MSVEFPRRTAYDDREVPAALNLGLSTVLGDRRPGLANWRTPIWTSFSSF